LNISDFFHGFTKERASQKQKPCQDGWTLIESSASSDPAMVFDLWMASILSGITGVLPVTPSGRIAAGRLRLSMTFLKKT
jgi:hypothetical protein